MNKKTNIKLKNIRRTASLAINPKQREYKKLKGTNAYGIRSGNYKIIYEIHDNLITIVIIYVSHRGQIY